MHYNNKCNFDMLLCCLQRLSVENYFMFQQSLSLDLVWYIFYTWLITIFNEMSLFWLWKDQWYWVIRDKFKMKTAMIRPNFNFDLTKEMTCPSVGWLGSTVWCFKLKMSLFLKCWKQFCSICTVKPVLRGHKEVNFIWNFLWQDKKEVTF